MLPDDRSIALVACVALIPAVIKHDPWYDTPGALR